MKKLLLLFILLISINSFSQMDELQNGNWYLYEMEVDDMVAIHPDTEPYIDYQSNFTDNTFSTNGCNYIVGEFENLNQNSFQLISVTITMIECQNEDYEFFDEFYFNIFSGNENGIFNYIIEPDPEYPNFKRLVITNPFGNKAYYHNGVLSNQDLSRNEISIHPNPVKEKLTIENKDSDISNIQIIDTNGKLIHNQKINSAKIEINFANYPKGVYFIKFESEGKIIKTEKIIKN